MNIQILAEPENLINGFVHVKEAATLPSKQWQEVTKLLNKQLQS